MKIYQQKIMATVSEEEVLACSICGHYSKDMLTLTCMHDPCLKCASAAFNTYNLQSSTSFAPIVYKCSLCAQYTDLNPQSVSHLRNYESKSPWTHEIQETHDTEQVQSRVSRRSRSSQKSSTPRNSRHQSLILQTSPKNKSKSSHLMALIEAEKSLISLRKQKDDRNQQTSMPKLPLQSNVERPPVLFPSVFHKFFQKKDPLKKADDEYINFEMCKTHTEEELSYICNDCNTPICPECVIHGTHYNHNVQSIREAMRNLKEILKENKKRMGASLGQVEQFSELYSYKLNMLGKERKQSIEWIKLEFARIRKIVLDKEKEMLSQIEYEAARNANVIKSEIQQCRQIEEKCRRLKTEIESCVQTRLEAARVMEYGKLSQECNEALRGVERMKKSATKSIDKESLERGMQDLFHGIATLNLKMKNNAKQI